MKEVHGKDEVQFKLAQRVRGRSVKSVRPEGLVANS